MADLLTWTAPRASDGAVACCFIDTCRTACSTASWSFAVVEHRRPPAVLSEAFRRVGIELDARPAGSRFVHGVCVRRG